MAVNTINLVVASTIIGELAGLIRRAVAAGTDITDAELDNVFAFADRADARWAEVNAAQKEPPNGNVQPATDPGAEAGTQDD